MEAQGCIDLPVSSSEAIEGRTATSRLGALFRNPLLAGVLGLALPTCVAASVAVITPWRGTSGEWAVLSAETIPGATWCPSAVGVVPSIARPAQGTAGDDVDAQNVDAARPRDAFALFTAPQAATRERAPSKSACPVGLTTLDVSLPPHLVPYRETTTATVSPPSAHREALVSAVADLLVRSVRARNVPMATPSEEK